MTHDEPIYVASDHAGFARKHELVQALRAEGFAVTDIGPQEFVPSDDYPDYAFAVARRVADDVNARGILLCGTGEGMCIAANKVVGVRAGLAWAPALAASLREDDDANVLCLPAKYLEAAALIDVARTWLATPFSGAERHVRRIGKIRQFERRDD
ncbi:MAG: RpiB/LacA/LacB family sugar-phosphate isomerase [Patescibacteria group bacterium]|jgi:RpiB/LacA/LacB family sugar-phosphate isomerase